MIVSYMENPQQRAEILGSTRKTEVGGPTSDPPDLADDGLPDKDDFEEDNYRGMANIMPDSQLLVLFWMTAWSLERKVLWRSLMVIWMNQGDITFDKEMDQEEDDIAVVPDLNPEVPLEHPLDGNMHSSDVPFDKE
ncbi:hypothetical protein R1sor_017221 [Riccia sorocarpa]|uniref:Uncharacterized protein n=1 Tax=Riccia sorocarpa TaxID=122646 RepID=A0ABD3ICE7_9MARC